MKKLLTIVSEKLNASGNNSPQANSLYIFWTAKIDGGRWMNGMCGDCYPYDMAHRRAIGDTSKFKEVFISDCEQGIKNLIEEKYPGSEYKLYYDIVPSGKISGKYEIIWKNCMVRKSTPECVFELTSGKNDLAQWEKQAAKEYEKIEMELRKEEERKAAEENKRKEEEEENQRFWAKLETYKNLGYMNGWETQPLPIPDQQKFDRAKDKKEVQIGRGHYVGYSDEEQIKWYIDSTD